MAPDLQAATEHFCFYFWMGRSAAFHRVPRSADVLKWRVLIGRLASPLPHEPRRCPIFEFAFKTKTKNQKTNTMGNTCLNPFHSSSTVDEDLYFDDEEFACSYASFKIDPVTGFVYPVTTSSSSNASSAVMDQPLRKSFVFNEYDAAPTKPKMKMSLKPKSLWKKLSSTKSSVSVSGWKSKLFQRLSKKSAKVCPSEPKRKWHSRQSSPKRKPTPPSSPTSRSFTPLLPVSDYGVKDRDVGLLGGVV